MAMMVAPALGPVARQKSVHVCENRGVLVTEAGSYLRLIDSCITQRKAEGHCRTCNGSKEEEEESARPQGCLSEISELVKEKRIL